MGRPSKYPDEFREAAVEMVRETGKPNARSRELGMNEGTLGNWVDSIGGRNTMLVEGA